MTTEQAGTRTVVDSGSRGPTCCAGLLSAGLLGTGLSTGSMSQELAGMLALRFKALADPIRLRLLSLIASREEVCPCDLTGHFDVSGPTISYHLRLLREAGLVTGARRGTWIYYRAQPDALRQLGDFLRLTEPDDPPKVARASMADATSCCGHRSSG